MGQGQSRQTADIDNYVIQWNKFSPGIDKNRLDATFTDLRNQIAAQQRRLYEVAKSVTSFPISAYGYDSFTPSSFAIGSAKKEIKIIGNPKWEYHFYSGPTIVQDIETNRELTATRRGRQYTIDSGIQGRILFTCDDNQYDNCSAIIQLQIPVNKAKPVGNNNGSAASRTPESNSSEGAGAGSNHNGGRRKTRCRSSRKKATRRRKNH
jgi:hypothetical protein